MKLGKIVAVGLSAVMLTTGFSLSAFAAQTNDSSVSAPQFKTYDALYAHAVLNSEDTQAWQSWQSEHNEDFNEINSDKKYFFLPSSADSEKVDIYNAYSSAITVNGVKIEPNSTASVPYKTNEEYSVRAGGKNFKLVFMKSTAESAVYINNDNADGNGTELMTYLNSDKSNSASATAAITDADGTLETADVKKIKGRGNSTWGKAKKPYNITFKDNVTIGSMDKCKKFSMLANYQDDSLSRNRFLYDLSDAVDMPYASDSRYVDFYSDGYYWGSYQMCQKIDTGKTNLLSDIDDTGYLNKDGSINENFQFVCEVDASANDDDYHFNSSSGNPITIKTPELAPGDTGYNEVKNYVKEKFDAFYNAIKSSSANLADYADVDSVTKIYLINELGKNWDSGVSSLYFTYKQDENGDWKFFGSPVWDYDNSLGNAKGVEWELGNIGVNDYEQYSGWWCKYKGKDKNSRNTNNVMNLISRNKAVLAAAPQVWFEDFVPAMQTFMSSGVSEGEIYSSDVYYSYIKGSAEMNYKSGWLLNTGSWIANHSKLNVATFDYSTGKYTVSNTVTKYSNDFDGMYNYCADWFTSRAAWLSSQMYDEYEPTNPRLENDLNNDGIVDVRDATALQLYIADSGTLDAEGAKMADINKDGIIDVRDVTALQQIIAQ
ncbi:CotH kinase family protein [uncultured Ruminococcus sp.]|uniref:CotH kinase family protein n=1 Tax=uncultured Ruminococcus sp. TaxID=165186 RepID=UPI0025E4954B|nr:CotH kinase family protein [uncultured Ruminococcus sp.]